MKTRTFAPVTRPAGLFLVTRRRACAGRHSGLAPVTPLTGVALAA